MRTRRSVVSEPTEEASPGAPLVYSLERVICTTDRLFASSGTKWETRSMRRAVAAALIVGVIAVATAAAHPVSSERRAAGTTVKTVFNAKLKSTILVTGKGLTL